MRKFARFVIPALLALLMIASVFWYLFVYDRAFTRDFLLKEIDCYIEHLSQYKAAMEQNDEEELIRLLDEGKKRKEEVDG